MWADVAPRAGIPIEQEGLYLTVRSPEAAAVIRAFLATEMGEGCAWLDAGAFRETSDGLGGPDLVGALHSPHEVRVESRTAIPRLTAWLGEALGVTFLNETVVFEARAPQLATSRGPVRAAAVVVCPGDDFTTLFAEEIARYRLRRCRLSMLKLADPGFRLPGALMSDLGLTRYHGYADLPEAGPLTAKLKTEHPGAFDNGVHLIVAQGADGGLIVGDSHHYADLPGPFAPAAAEDEILAEFTRALGRPAPPVLERWTGVYAVADDRPYLIAAPAPDVRLAMVTSGSGASTSFGLAERVLGDLLGLETGASARASR